MELKDFVLVVALEAEVERAESRHKDSHLLLVLFIVLQLQFQTVDAWAVEHLAEVVNGVKVGSHSRDAGFHEPVDVAHQFSVVLYELFQEEDALLRDSRYRHSRW